jgi:hypothetical protein
MNPPSVTGTFEDLPPDPKERHEAFVTFLGQHLFSIRNQRLGAIRRLVESRELRNRLGTIHRRPYETVGALDEAGQEAAIALVQTAIDLFMQDLLGLFQNIGPDVRLGRDHALRYKLWLEVIDLTNDDEPTVAAEVVNRGGQRALETYFGRWLDKYSTHE